MSTCLSNQSSSSCLCKSNSEKIKQPTLKQAEDNDDDNDVWAEDESDNDNATNTSVDRQQQQLAYKDVIRKHRKQGYVDGITAHREDQLQRGFDDAFPRGAKFGIEVGRILAKLKCKQGRKEEEENGQNVEFKRAINDLSISKVLDRQYFDEQLEPMPTHELIENWKQKSSS